MRMDLLLCRSKQRNALHAIHRLILYIERMRRSESLDANARRVSGPVTCKISGLFQTLTQLVLIRGFLTYLGRVTGKQMHLYLCISNSYRISNPFSPRSGEIF